MTNSFLTMSLIYCIFLKSLLSKLRILIIQKYTCLMYNAKKSIDVDDGRFQLFVHSYKAAGTEENFNKKLRSCDASSIPPCKSELFQQVLRTHYISRIWKNAHMKEPTSLSPTEYGWMEIGNCYVFKWFEGDQLPSSVSDLILNSEGNNSIVTLF